MVLGRTRRSAGEGFGVVSPRRPQPPKVLSPSGSRSHMAESPPAGDNHVCGAEPPRGGDLPGDEAVSGQPYTRDSPDAVRRQRPVALESEYVASSVADCDRRRPCSGNRGRCGESPVGRRLESRPDLLRQCRRPRHDKTTGGVGGSNRCTHIARTGYDRSGGGSCPPAPDGRP